MSEPDGIVFDKIEQRPGRDEPPKRVIETSIDFTVFKEALVRSDFCWSYHDFGSLTDATVVISGNGGINNVRIVATDGKARFSMYPYIEEQEESFEKIAEIVRAAAQELYDYDPLENLYEDFREKTTEDGN